MSHFGLQAALSLMWVPLYMFLAVYYAVFTLRERYNLYFSFLFALMGVYAFAGAGLYSSPGPEVGVGWQRIQMLSAAYAFPTILLFMRSFAGKRLRSSTVGVLYAISTVFAVSIYATPWFFTREPATKEFMLWGLSIRYPEMDTGWVGALFFVWGMAVITISMQSLIKPAIRKRRGAMILLCSVALILLCAVNDMLVAMNVYQFLYVTEHGFAVFAIAAAFFMLDRFLMARRDLELQSQHLLLANQELQGLDAMKEDLLANISHELRTPLVSIRGYVEIMLEGKLGPVTDEQTNGLKVALRNVSRLLGLIGNLLDYAKLRDGRVRLKRRVVDLREVVMESVEAVTPQIEDAGLHLVKELPADDELLVRGDAGKLRQVFDNLLSNAIKFTGPGGEIRVEASRSDEGWIRAAVQDNGIGIPDRKVARIFERFYQVGPTGQGQDRGISSAGVGLAIVREIVRLHQGDVLVHSREDEGSRFEIRLPKAAKTEELVRPPRAVKAAAGRGSRLLLVDDDREVVEFLSLAMSAEGYDVQVAKDGATALQRCREHEFDLMLLDLTMQGISGVEVLEKLRGHKKTEGMPVIIVTALGGDEVRRKCLASGADDFLLKPVAVDDLRRVVARVLSLHAAQQRPVDST